MFGKYLAATMKLRVVGRDRNSSIFCIDWEIIFTSVGPKDVRE